MKRILMLLCSLLISLNIAADGHITAIKNLIDKGDYETAKKKIEIYEKLYPKEFTKDVVAFWMQKCDDGIAKKNRDEEIKVAEANAKRKEEEKRKQEAKLERERLQKEEARKQNKFVYKSVNATTIGGKEYAGMSRAIKADGVKFTDKEELAYWSVYITAEVYDQKQNEHGENLIDYKSFVVAYLKIVNNITNSVIHQEEIKMNGSNTSSLEGATIKAYNKINKTIGEKIQELCK